MSMRNVRFCPKEDALLIKLWYSSLLDKQIAERMGRHRGVFRKRAAKLNLPNRTSIRAAQGSLDHRL